MDAIPVVDLIDSQEDIHGTDSLHDSSSSKIPIINVMDRDSYRNGEQGGLNDSQEITPQDYSELDTRISKLEECLQKNASNKQPKGAIVSRKEFNSLEDRINKLEQRVQKIEDVIDKLKNVFSEDKEALKCTGKSMLSPTSINNKRPSASKALTPAKKANRQTSHLENHSKTLEPIEPPGMVDVPSTSGQNNEVDSDLDIDVNQAEELELLPQGRLPIKQELFERQQAPIEQSTEDFRRDAEGRIVAFICGLARKIRNKNEYAAVYCWSVTDTAQSYYSEMETNHIKIEAEILAALFAIQHLKANAASNDLKITIVCRWKKLIEVMTRNIYPHFNTCQCTEFPCAHAFRWLSNEKVAKQYKEDIPKLFLAQDGLDINWVLYSSSYNRWPNNSFFNYVNGQLLKTLRK